MECPDCTVDNVCLGCWIKNPQLSGINWNELSEREKEAKYNEIMAMVMEETDKRKNDNK
jgi:predicted Fe-S protein YdhL (DUF1289 family)